MLSVAAALSLSFCPIPKQLDCENRNYFWLVLAITTEKQMPDSP
jgi:hypothetical protein